MKFFSRREVDAVDRVGSGYFGDRNEAAVYLSDHGWQMGGSTIRELFAANGLPPIVEDDLPFADRLYVSGTLTDKK